MYQVESAVADSTEYCPLVMDNNTSGGQYDMLHNELCMFVLFKNLKCHEMTEK